MLVSSCPQAIMDGPSLPICTRRVGTSRGDVRRSQRRASRRRSLRTHRATACTWLIAGLRNLHRGRRRTSLASACSPRALTRVIWGQQQSLMSPTAGYPQVSISAGRDLDRRPTFRAGHVGSIPVARSCCSQGPDRESSVRRAAIQPISTRDRRWPSATMNSAVARSSARCGRRIRRVGFGGFETGRSTVALPLTRVSEQVEAEPLEYNQNP